LFFFVIPEGNLRFHWLTNRQEHQMSSVQLFFSSAGLFTGHMSAQTVVLVMCINAKIDPLQKQVDSLISFMVNHEGRIGKLEGKAQG